MIRGARRRNLVIVGLKREHSLNSAAGSVLLEVFVPDHRHAGFLQWLTLVLFRYVAVVLVADISWADLAFATFVPSFSAFSG